MTTKIQQAIDYIFAHPGCRSDALGELLGCKPQDVYAYIKDAIHAGLIVTCKIDRPGQSPVAEFRPSASAPAKAPNWQTWKKEQREPVKPLKQPADPRRVNRGNVSDTPAGGGANNTGSSGSEHLPCKTQPEAVAVVEPTKPEASPVASSSNEIKQPKYDPRTVSFNPEERAVAIACRNHNLISEIIEACKFPEDSPVSDLPGWIAQRIAVPEARVAALESEANKPANQIDEPESTAPSDDFECHLSHEGRLHIFLGEAHPVVKLTPAETQQLGKFLIATEPAWA